MKNSYLIPFAVFLLFAATGCDRQTPEVARKIAELEQKNQKAADRQRELEQELEEQKLAVERDAIERERVKIEEDRAELERQQGAVAAEQDQALREREDALFNREGRLEQFQSALEEKEDEIHQQAQQLSERDRELAGREALAVEEPAPSEPVADYDMFYDSLSSYGSWFETADYGYVWQPVAVRDSNWRPYCRGRWACSDRGWTWVSDEPFGWATYHYGRWTLLRGRGWIWVPGTEWAPCWVSWRENNSHIGWAPLPPETLAYRGHHWDSSVDVQFGIGALCYNFVEIRHFGSSLYGRCLPVSANDGCFQQTANITYIHINNRQVICGGPKYKKVCEGVGRPLPFYRLEIDRHPRPGRDTLAMRPRIKGDHLVVSAPNMDVAWNDGLKPKRIKDRIETVNVERNGTLGREITDRYRQTREEGRRKAETAIVELGGADQFQQRREVKLQDNRRLADGRGRKEETRDLAQNPQRRQRDVPDIREPGRDARPIIPDPKVDPVRDRIVRQPNENRPRPETVDDRRNPVVRETLRVTPTEEVKPRPEPRSQQPTDDRRIARANEPEPPVDTRREQPRQVDPAVIARQEAQARETQRHAKQMEADQDTVKRRQDEQTRQAQQEAIKRQQAEQTQQRQLEKQQQQAEQAREAQNEAARQQREQERAQLQQQEIARQREQERVQRQQQEDRQREMQRQQERAQQQRQEEARQQRQEEMRQRQQEENQRQQENARQRQQEENQRQRQQEESRQKQERDQKVQDDQRKRGR